MIDQLFDMVLILLIAYGHIIVFIDTGRMAQVSKMSVGGDRPSRSDSNFDSANFPIGITQPATKSRDGWTQVDRTMFLAETVQGVRKIPVICDGVTRYITL